MAYTLEGLIEDTGVTAEDVEGRYDWGYRANSMQLHNQVRYMKQFKLAPSVCTILQRLAKLKKESQASICEGLINGEFERLQEQGVFPS